VTILPSPKGQRSEEDLRILHKRRGLCGKGTQRNRESLEPGEKKRNRGEGIGFLAHTTQKLRRTGGRAQTSQVRARKRMAKSSSRKNASPPSRPLKKLLDRNPETHYQKKYRGTPIRLGASIKDPRLAP